MKKEDFRKQYEDITFLYDLAEELASTIESEFVKDSEKQLALVEPLINEVADATDILTEEYLNLLENPSNKKSAKNRVEGALRKIFMALEDYRARLKDTGVNTLGALANIADIIADKIHKQAEKITIIFMHLIQMSLDRVMRKHEMDEFKRANEKLVNTLLLQHAH